MSGPEVIRRGMPVYGADGQPVGTVDAFDGEGIRVRGRLIPAEALARVERDGIYLHEAAARSRAATDGTAGGLAQAPPPSAPGPARSFPTHIEEEGLDRKRREAMEQAKRRSERVSGVSNVAYDLTALLANKLAGIAAIEEYKLDARDAGDQEVQGLLDQLQGRAREDVDQLRRLLVRRLQ